MAINITAKGDPEKKLKWAFKMYDVDGNGEIDKSEMLQIITVSKLNRLFKPKFQNRHLKMIDF